MNIQKQMLAADFGASSGRVMSGCFDGNKITIDTLHRFSNDPVVLGNTMYWDFPRLFHELKQGILASKSVGEFDSIGVDTWGVDFGLLDSQGYLLENPVHYRDSRTTGMLEQGFCCLDQTRFYELTGNQFMEINTAFQLLSIAKHRPELLERADKLLLMPDLFNYFLSGQMAWEYTESSTTQLLDAKKREWSKEVLSSLSISDGLFGTLTMPGTKIGILRENICTELGVKPMDVIAVAGHDTQCALAAVPTTEKDFLFVSCGTWSLFGTEIDEPVIDENSIRYNVTNEGGFGGKISFLKNIIGTWLIQESRRQWKREGQEYSFGELEEMAGRVLDNESYIDPDDEAFVPAGNIPERIRKYCEKSGQKIPQTVAEIVRCIDESLALKYRMAMEEISICTGKSYGAIHIVGGGVQSKLLCQLVADVCGVPVYAGPIEATVYGNLAIQLAGAKEISGLEEIRQVIRNSEDVVAYEPQGTEKWDEIYSRFKEKIVKK